MRPSQLLAHLSIGVFILMAVLILREDQFGWWMLVIPVVLFIVSVGMEARRERDNV